MHVEAVGDQLSRNREFGERSEANFRRYRKSQSRESPISRDDARYMYIRAKVREIIEMFSFTRQESTTPEQEQLPGTILIGQDRGRIEHVRSNYRSKRNVRPQI